MDCTHWSSAASRQPASHEPPQIRVREAEAEIRGLGKHAGGKPDLFSVFSGAARK
jgi:hypothetical protein